MATTGATTSGSSSSNVSAATIGAGLAQPVISAIQQNIEAFLPSSLASAITSQFAGAPVLSSATSGTGSSSGGSTAPAPIFNFPSSGSSGTAASIGLSLAQPTINAILNDISSFLPSSLASAITSQFAAAPSASSQGGGLTLQFSPGMPPMLVSITSSGG